MPDDTNLDTAVKSPPERAMDAAGERPEARRNKPAGPRADSPRRAGSASPLRIYKPGQGTYVRWGSAAAGGVVAVAGANFLFNQLSRFESTTVQYFIPVGLVVGLFYALYRLIGRHETVVNFMIATESEMKKVNWSSRREVTGATKVVIVTTLALALILFVVDLLFIVFFSSIDILQVDLLGAMFGREGS